ncbi:MAG: DnaJ domain-containing protein [Desulfovibrio sp.]|nr:DnaJ domain-containing protein [Desulfovibrio sp.]
MRRSPRKLSLQQCCEILEIEKDADHETVKHAYRRRAFELHPDLHPDSPNASQRFQLLNEAYVALTAMLSAKAAHGNGAATAEGEADKSARQGASPTKNDAQEQNDSSECTSGQTSRHNDKPTAGTKDNTSKKTAARKQNEKQSPSSQKEQNAYAEQDVLRDLLNDPFARRVFEDIYRELNHQQSQQRATPPHSAKHAAAEHRQPNPHAAGKKHETTKLHQGNIAWGTPKWSKEMNKGVGNIVKGWLKRQIDEEQCLSFPAANLLPGKKLRLQIRQGISNEIRTVEITLPKDFVPGKPIRLKGLGKKIGPWQGDLYLTIEAGE